MFPPHKLSNKRTSSFQVDKEIQRKLVFKLCRSCSHEGLFEPRTGAERLVSFRQKPSKKMQLSGLLNAVTTVNSRKASVETNNKLGSRLSNSKARMLCDNKSFVS
jgi:hypothetical protein